MLDHTNRTLKKERIMRELLKSVVYTGIGTAFLTKEKIEALKNELVEQGKISQDEGKQFVDELVKKTASIMDSLDLKISLIIEEKIKQLDIPTNADFADLRRQVEELQVALNKNPEA
jgi:polyhydroxyalkanoate synthesis regulator phasin